MHLCLFPFSFFLLFMRTHLYYSHAIYRIKYLSWTFPIQFNACYFDVLTFQWWCCSCCCCRCCCWGCRRFKAIQPQKKAVYSQHDSPKKTHIFMVARMHAQNESDIGKRTASEWVSDSGKEKGKKLFINYIWCVGFSTKSNWKFRRIWYERRNIYSSHAHIHTAYKLENVCNINDSKWV